MYYKSITVISGKATLTFRLSVNKSAQDLRLLSWWYWGYGILGYYTF